MVLDHFKHQGPAEALQDLRGPWLPPEARRRSPDPGASRPDRGDGRPPELDAPTRSVEARRSRNRRPLRGVPPESTRRIDSPTHPARGPRIGWIVSKMRSSKASSSSSHSSGSSRYSKQMPNRSKTPGSRSRHAAGFAGRPAAHLSQVESSIPNPEVPGSIERQFPRRIAWKTSTDGTRPATRSIGGMAHPRADAPAATPRGA